MPPEVWMRKKNWQFFLPKSSCGQKACQACKRHQRMCLEDQLKRILRKKAQDSFTYHKRGHRPAIPSCKVLSGCILCHNQLSSNCNYGINKEFTKKNLPFMKIVAKMVNFVDRSSDAKPVWVWLTDLAGRAKASVVDEFFFSLDLALFASSG